jgi:hypothetical protein
VLPTTLALGDSVSATFAVYDQDGFTTRAVTAAQTFLMPMPPQLELWTGGANSTRVTQVTVPAGQSAAPTVYVKAVAPGTGAITSSSNQNYQPFTTHAISVPASVASPFNANAEGWTTAGTPSPVALVYVATGGNPGGYIRTTDPGDGAYTYFQAPARFVGNRAGFYRGTLAFDFRTSAADVQSANDVVLVGATETLVYDIPTDITTAWGRFAVPLTEGTWRVGSLTGAVATAAQLQAVLADLRALRIRAEYHGSAGDIGQLDNVAMTGPPPPGSAVASGDVVIRTGPVRE